MNLRPLSVSLGLALCLLGSACSSDDADGKTAGVPPSGVFSRTSADGQPVRLAFVSGKGARLATQVNSAGNEITERTCFAYEAAVKATLKKKVVVGKGVSTEQDLAGRIVERSVSMNPDGSKLESDAFLEDGKFSYERDTATSAADVMDGCP